MAEKVTAEARATAEADTTTTNRPIGNKTTHNMSNTIGNILRLTTFGESHGEAIGGVIDGFPAGIDIDMDFVQHQLDRRRPGQSRLTTQRNESDRVEILSGVFEGKSTGAPIGFIVRNTNQHSHDYDNMRRVFRPSHADYTYYNKYGIRDHRGGGRSSARVTISRCVGGALAMLALKQIGVSITAYTSQVGGIALDRDYHRYDLRRTDDNDVRCPDADKAAQMEELIMQVKSDGDTIGGGFDMASHRGSEVNDLFDPDGSHVTLTNHSGGIQGGISNGEDICFRVAFKPVATLLRPQATIDTDGNATQLEVKGRHDPCVLPRAVPVVEAMAAMVILDCYLVNKTIHL